MNKLSDIERIDELTVGANIFLDEYYEPSAAYEITEESFFSLSDTETQYSIRVNDSQRATVGQSKKEERSTVQHTESEPNVRYSLAVESTKYDSYNADQIARLLRDTHGCSPESIDMALGKAINQTFTDKLISLIREKGLRDADVYKAAQMDRRLFSKILSNREYKPSKDTVLALVFALKLSFSQATDLLSRAGFTLSHSSKRDVILEYFIREEIYDLMDINMVLYKLDQRVIG